MPTENKPESQVRVLVIEDEPLVSMLLSDLIEDAGFAAVGDAATAQAALEIAEARRPSVALIDVSLGGAREGLQIAAELARRGMAIIFVSGHADVSEWAEVRELEPVAVLQKPCPPDRVIEALKAAAQVGRPLGSAGVKGAAGTSSA